MIKRSQVIWIACHLAVWPVTLLFPVTAQAIPGDPAVPHSATLATPAEPDDTAPVTQPVNREPAAPVSGTQNPATVQAGVTPFSHIPCLSAFSDQESAEYDVTESSCSDTVAEPQRMSVQFGRRFDIGAGILGKTDGLRFDYRLGNGIMLNGVAGYAVNSDKDTFNPDRQVFGLSADSGPIARTWNLNAYVVERQERNRADSTTFGGTLRYLQQQKSLLLFLDYDTNEASRSAFMASGAWRLPNATTISATFDVRNSPVHSRQKKYLQHTMAALKNWAWVLPTERIKHYTQDRQQEVKTLGVGLSHTFSQRLKFSGDMAVLDIASRPAPGDAQSTSLSPSEYFYHVKFTGKDLMIPGNNGKLDLRHSVSATSRTSSASLNTKYAINRLWNITPRLSTNYQVNAADNSARWVTSPAVKMEYHWKEFYGFQVEAGGKWSTVDNADTGKRHSSYFMNMAYQINF